MLKSLFTKKLFLIALLVFTLSLVALPTFAASVFQAPAPSGHLSIQGKILLVASLVFPLLQTVKKFFPAIGGIYGVVFNVAFSTVGMVIAAQPGEIFTLQFFVALLSAALIAAGYHGTFSKLTS